MCQNFLYHVILYHVNRCWANIITGLRGPGSFILIRINIKTTQSVLMNIQLLCTSDSRDILHSDRLLGSLGEVTPQREGSVSLAAGVLCSNIVDPLSRNIFSWVNRARSALSWSHHLNVKGEIEAPPLSRRVLQGRIPAFCPLLPTLRLCFFLLH